VTGRASAVPPGTSMMHVSPVVAATATAGTPSTPPGEWTEIRPLASVSAAAAVPAPETRPRSSAERTPARPEEGAAAAKDTSLAAERALIDMARTAVARGDGAGALGPLERHAEEFPNGRMTEEREWLRVQALLASGRGEEARERASSFRRAFPHSLMLPALDEILSSSPPR
jgi:hypothetical protein